MKYAKNISGKAKRGLAAKKQMHELYEVEG